MSRVRRVFHDGPLASGRTIELAEDEARHLRQVLRLHVGDAVAVFDGRGGEHDGEVEELGRGAVTVRLGAARTDPVEPPLRIALYQALCRPDRMEWVIQKGTEIGVSVFRPLRCERAEERRITPARLERWRRIAREACKQSGRRVVPEVDEPRDEAPPPRGGATAIVLDPSAMSPLGAALPASAGEVWLAVGPEGGFTEPEIGALRETGWIAASLGPRVLRTETAGVCAAAVVLHRLGDFGGGAALPRI